ncbi:hypothetical protein Trydic_g10335 [Trypoxylus dichotomus]
MNVVHIVWICLIFCGCYQSAIIERQEDDRVKRRASLLTTDAADNVGYHDRNGQSDPRYLDVISKDHSKQLDNLEDVRDGTLEQTVKEKRCKTEGIVGVPSTLSLGRRDTTFALLKRSCENCWNSLMCKTKGKCESCKKICDKVEAVYEEMQVYEPIDQKSNQTEILGVSNKMSESVQEEGGLYYGENRYYTLGSFQPGPIYSLLAKLLNINNMEHVEQLLILAKTKSKKPIKTERPVVIDTAHVFTLNQGRPSKVDVEVHEVNGGDSNIDSFALELDKEIEKAMKMKKKKSGASHLAPSEIDNIIWKAIGRDPDKNARKLSELEWNDSPTHYSKDNTDDVGNQNFEKQKVKQNAPSAVSDHQFQRLTGQTLEEDALAQQEPSYLNSEVASPPLLSNSQSLLSEVSPVPERSHAGLSRSYKQDQQLVNKESSKAKQREQDYEDVEQSETSTKKHMQTTPIPIVQTTPFMKHPVVPQRSMVDDSDESLENEGVSIPPTTPETVIVSLQQFHNKIPNENKESQQPTNSRNQKYSNEKTMEGPDWKHVVSKESSKAKQREQDYEEIEPSETSTKKHMQFPSGPSKNNPRGPKEPRLTSAAPRPVLTSKFPHGPKDPGGIRTTPIPIVQTTPSMKHPVVPQRSKVDDSDESLENEGFTIPPTTPETDTVSLQQFHNKKPNGNEESQQPTNSRNQKYSNEKTMEEPDWKHVVSKESSKAKQREQDYEEIEPSETSTKKHMQFPSGPSKNNPRGPKEPRLTSTAPHPVLTSKFPHGPKDPGGIRTTPIPIVQTTPFMKHPVVPQRSKVDDSDESLENEGFTIPPTTPETDTVSLQQFHNKKPNGNGESQQPTNPISQKYSNEKIMKVADLEDRHINRGQDLPQRNADNDYKYKQLKQWIMKHSHKLPPDLRDSLPEFQEKSGNKLAQNVNDIISSASKINEEISNIVETDTSNPNLVQMVKKNDEKLRAISDDNDKYIIGFPNMNKFKTRIAPETQRKIDQIFASERPLASVRKMKDLYGFHPRMKSEYRDGKWVYEKTKPNRPPYSTNHRTPTVLNDQQMLEDNASNEKSREAAVTYVDPKLLNMDSVMKGLKNTPKMYYDKTNKVLGVKQYETMDEQNTNPIISTQHQSEQENMQGDEASRIVHEGQESAISQKKLTQNIPNNNQDHKEDESKENSSEKKNKSNETVACSKEEEEEMLEVLHLHPISYGEYRSSEREGSTDRQSNNLNHSWGKVKLHSATEVPTAKNDNIQSQHPLKHIADETERIINSLSNKHNIADTDDTTNNQARNEEDDDIKNKKQFIPFQPAYFSPQHRNFVPMRTVPEMTQESINRNFMKQPMIFEPNTNNMEQELIGIPAMSSRMQKPYLEGLTRMGKFVPRDGERRLSLHSRDVSEQEKSKDIYFIGDGIKLPLNMEEHNDGSVHLTVDIKSLCNCKHCRGKQLENGTIVLEATPLTEKERQEHEAETKANKLPEKKDEKNTTTYDEYVYEDYMLYVDTEESLEDEKINPMAHNDKVNVSKRSAGSTNSLQDNEIESSISSTSEEDPVIPLKHLSRQEILDRLAEIKEKEKNLKDDHKKLETNNSNDQHDDSDGDKINPKFQLFTNVLDFVKKIALDIQPKK